MCPFLWMSSSMYPPSASILAQASIPMVGKNEVGCRDDTDPKTVETRMHCEN